MIKDLLKKNRDSAAPEIERLGFLDGKKVLDNLKTLSKTALSDGLDDILNISLSSPSPDDCLTNLERVSAAAGEASLKKILKAKEGLKRLVFLCGSSPYLSNILSLNPDLFEELFLKNGLDVKKDLPVFKEELLKLTEGTEGAEGFPGMAKVLRQYRNREYLRIGGRDLLGLASMEEVTAELSDLAQACLDCGVEFCLKEQEKIFGTPVYIEEDGREKTAEFCVIGLGKLGGRELNFLSDIDIIYIYSSDKGETTGKNNKESTKISLHAFFVKLAERLTKLISAVTEDGIAFRVDLDLRPEGRSGDLANSLRSAEIYYESWGQMWERCALIKARAVGGSKELGERFLKMIGPFVFRRYLDFTAIEEIKAMKEKIDLNLLRRRPDTIDVKLGEGGIREIEFFCQAIELIHGGKNPDIREKNTLRAIEKLNENNLLGGKEAEILRDGYIFLRNLEHRIQIVEGRQTQAIPAKKEALKKLSRMMGFKDTPEKKAEDYFWKVYREKTEAVYSVYRSLFYKSEKGLKEGIPEEVFLILSSETPEKEALSLLKNLGFKDTGVSLKDLKLLRYGPPFLHLNARARVLLEKLSPLFLLKASISADPDMALKNIERFISAIGARTSLYSLLAENPALISELMKIFGFSAFLSNALIERPENMDLLFSEEMAKPKKEKEEFSRELEGIISPAGDYEERLDALRHYRNQEVFRVAFNDIRENLSAGEVSAQLTALAEVFLEVSYKMALGDLRKKYGREGDDGFFICGMGKLGGRELIYGSDLDIFFVYSDEGEKTETAGPRVISNHEFFAHLAQRIISILSLRTKEGIIFTVDTRLRPSGSSGPLVVSKTSFLRYQMEKAGVWERQAAIKARFAAGKKAFAEKVLKELEAIIYSRPLKKEEISELLRIRKRMEVEIAKETPKRFDIKAGRGGLVDIEFLAQALQMNFGGRNPSLRTPSTLTALKKLSDAGIISKEDYGFLSETCGFYRLLETRMRIVHDTPACVLREDGWEAETLARRVGYGSGEKLLADYIKRREKVRELYLKVMEGLKNQ